MDRSDGRSDQPARDEVPTTPTGHHPVVHSASEVVAVPIMSLRPGESPRLNGEDKAHIARLAETEAPLPPILVARRTMRVIDGMHRLMAASMQGQETIDVVFYDGSEEEVFLRAVQENVTHGLPLSQADRRAAAERIIASHPRMSDRAISQCVGLAAKTVAAIRKRSTDDVPQLNARVGRDGRLRPLDSGEGRRRAAELLIRQPQASLRDVARAVGISPATVLDVRKRLDRGDSPVPEKVGVVLTPSGETRSAEAGISGAVSGGMSSGGVASARSGARADDSEASAPAQRPGSRCAVPAAPAVTVQKLLRDPSLRNNEQGKRILRLLHINAVGAEQLRTAGTVIPPHCAAIVVQLARQYAKMWLDFAMELDGRARIIDPTASR